MNIQQYECECCGVERNATHKLISHNNSFIMKTVKEISELWKTSYKKINSANHYFVFQAGMECLVRILLLWATVLSWTKVNGQFSGRTREVFFVNLEEGFFGCQVNETADVLQIFKIKKLCDGVSDCFRGSDENSKELKCSSKWNININISTKYHIDTLFFLRRSWSVA